MEITNEKREIIGIVSHYTAKKHDFTNLIILQSSYPHITRRYVVLMGMGFIYKKGPIYESSKTMESPLHQSYLKSRECFKESEVI